MSDSSKTWAGVVCGVAAGALWGLVFLAPELVRDFTPLQIASARYLAYGAISAALVAPRWRALAESLGGPHWLGLFRLSFLGNVLYYVLLANAVQLGGMAMASLVVGMLPVTVTLIGIRDPGAAPLRRLAPSLLLGAAGVACIAGQSLGGDDAGTQSTRLVGLLCAVGALVAWTAYAVENARWLARLDHVSAYDWNLLAGLTTGALALLLVIPAWTLGGRSHAPAAWLRFVGVASGLAIFASIVGNALWNRMSRLLPLTMVGQMILFETLFALVYAFLWEWRPPTAAEALAMVLVTASVLACVSAHHSSDVEKAEAASAHF